MNQLTAGAGGLGAHAGLVGAVHIHGGAGGDGGAAMAGGIFIQAGAGSTNTSTLTNSVLDGNVVSAGRGGQGGAGELARGGNGGAAAGGGLYNNSLNSTTPSGLRITASTLAANKVTGGLGGNAGVATTANGGIGGSGGIGGNAQGGGVFNGDNTTLSVINSTIGAPSAGNVLTGGNGGSGGDAGTPKLAPSNNGGNGGAGGNAQGGGVFVKSGRASFLNDTIAANVISAVSLGGAGGSGAGGGSAGMPGANGSARGGGFFNAGTTDAVIGNTILDLNSAPINADVSGQVNATAPSGGHNIFGSVAGITGTGLDASNQVGVSAARLALGNLQNNGGPTPTALIGVGSVALNTGDKTLDTAAGVTTDQRGFARVSGSNVDVGAVERTFAHDGVGGGGALVGVAFNKFGLEMVGAVFPDSVMATYPNGMSGSVFAVGVASTSVAFSPNGSPVLEIIRTDGSLTQYDSTGTHVLAANVVAASVTFDSRGNEILDVIHTDGSLTQFDSTHPTGMVMASNVAAVTTAVSPTGQQVLDVIRTDGSLTQYDSTHPTGVVLAGNAVGASVAFDPLGNEVLEVVRNDGSLTQYDSSGAHMIAVNVMSAATAFSPVTHQQVIDVLFQDGTLFQYDQFGRHQLPTF
jgi:hypothetical protein